MERILGPDLGRLVRTLHEEHGVIFHLQETASAVEGRQIRLKGGSALDADLVVAGVGVLPRVELAEAAGLKVDRGVIVDAYLETSSPGIFALHILGRRRRFADVPFFWSQHYDIPINYVGHAEKWDELIVEGDIADKVCSVRFRRGGRTLAVASIFRDVQSLEAEVSLERDATR
jgi:hypothetical protein